MENMGYSIGYDGWVELTIGGVDLTFSYICMSSFQ